MNTWRLKNTLSSVLFCTFIIGLFSCDELEDLFTFKISNESEISIGSSSPANLPFEVATPDVTTNSSQQFENNNSNVNLVKDIRLESLLLTINAPDDQTFSFLKSITIYISTDSSNEIELASLDEIPETATVIELTPTQAKLDEYVKAESYKLRTEVVTRQILTEDVDLTIANTFKVTANL